MRKLIRLVAGLYLVAGSGMACNPAGSGGGNASTTFKGVAVGFSTMSIVTFKVGTVNFSPPALFSSPLEASQSSTVSASGTLLVGPFLYTAQLSGTWDDNTNMLSISNSDGYQMTGSYVVSTNDIRGIVTFPDSSGQLWEGLRGASGTVYCGTWNPNIGIQLFGFVVSGGIVRGYGDTNYGPVIGTSSGNTIQFDYTTYSGSATIGASGVSGTINGVAFSGNVCA